MISVGLTQVLQAWLWPIPVTSKIAYLYSVRCVNCQLQLEQRILLLIMKTGCSKARSARQLFSKSGPLFLEFLTILF